MLPASNDSAARRLPGMSVVPHVRSVVAMSTVVSIRIVPTGDDDWPVAACEAALTRAFRWFHHIEDVCSRFRDDSEVMRLARSIGVPMVVSPILLETVQFAVAVARETSGAFDPTLGARMADRGFNVDHRTGRRVQVDVDGGLDVDYRDVAIDADAGTITLLRPLVLDLGAVAKGLAVDMAAKELGPFGNFAIDAGGDLYLGGLNGDREPWSVGIRDPRRPDDVIETIRVSNTAVCTSGGYERPSPGGNGHHIIDARTGASPDVLSSVTVLAPTALVADALATAAFVLGPVDGLSFLERQGVRAALYSPALERITTAEW